MCIKPKSVNRTFKKNHHCFTSEGMAVLPHGPFMFSSFRLVCAFLGSGSRPRQLLSSGRTLGAWWRDRRVGRRTTHPRLRFWGLTITRVHFIPEDDLTWRLFYSCCIFLLYLWSMYLMCPLISRWNYTYYMRVKNYLKNSHYYDCHRNEWLLPHLARLYLHAVFRKQNLSELNLWKMQKVSTAYQHYMTWFEYFFVEIIFVWSCNKL